jgi:hypothetical protein
MVLVYVHMEQGVKVLPALLPLLLDLADLNPSLILVYDYALRRLVRLLQLLCDRTALWVREIE